MIGIEIVIAIVVVMIVVAMIASTSGETIAAVTMTAGEMQVGVKTAASVVRAETEMGEGSTEASGTVVATIAIARETKEARAERAVPALRPPPCRRLDPLLLPLTSSRRRRSRH